MNLRATSIVAITSLSLIACDSGVPGNSAISESALSADLHVLADDSMGGRLVASSGLDQASAWIADRFESLGLAPAGDRGGYFQRFGLAWFSLGVGNRLTVEGAGPSRTPGQGWTPSNAGVSGSASGSVVFAGFGIVEPRLDHDDYQGADVNGRIVLMLEREPGVADPSSPFDGIVTAEASRTWRKVLAAQERGATAVLFVRDIHNREDINDWPAVHNGAWPDEPRRIERFTLEAWAEQITIPAAQISAELAATLVEGSGRTLEELAVEAESAEGGLGVVDLGSARADLRTEVERHVSPGTNVLAMIEGSDPDLRDEVVIIGAHHDHNGMDGEVVYNGADDDGSGTVGVLAIAEAYAQAAASGDLPARSVIFAIWDAEERGLLGAWYYTQRPLFPLQSTVANLNMDMIGRHEEVPTDGGGRFRGLNVQSAESNSNATNILGYSYTPELVQIVQDANRFDLTLRLRYDNSASNLLRRSDHWPFLQSGVPAVWFHNGLHPDYHTPNDTPDRIEYEKMTRIVKLVHETSWSLANAVGRPGLAGMGSSPPS
jgi:Zn-dependent M28 family amino/carboxypeptidase